VTFTGLAMSGLNAPVIDIVYGMPFYQRHTCRELYTLEKTTRLDTGQHWSCAKNSRRWTIDRRTQLMHSSFGS